MKKVYKHSILFIIFLLQGPWVYAEQPKKSRYLGAYGKAYRDYSRQIHMAQQKGKPMSEAEKKKLYEEIFTESKEAYLEDAVEHAIRLEELGKSVGKSKPADATNGDRSSFEPVHSKKNERSHPSHTRSSVPTEAPQAGGAREVLFHSEE